MSKDGKLFYATNLPAGGLGALYTISTRTNSVVGNPVDSPFPVPHNVAVSNDGTKVYVTHSGGSADKVTVYQQIGTAEKPRLRYLAEITVGLNPFGLAYVP